MDTVTVASAAKVTGLTPGQISNLIFFGVIEPEVHVGVGTGDSSVLSDKNVKELKLVAKLKTLGIKRDSIKNIIKLLTTSDLKWWEQEDGYVVIMKDSWFVTDNVFDPQNKKRVEQQAAIIIKL